MESIDLEPGYSTNEVSGKCIKCLVEQEMGGCLRRLLGSETARKELQQEYVMLVEFLKSSDSAILRDEAERYLAEGKKVKLRLASVTATGKPTYELIIE